MKENNTIVQKRIHRYLWVGIFLVLAFFAVFVLNIITGSVPVSVGDIIGILTGAAGDTNVSKIIWIIRLPRVIMAALLGGALAVSGFLLQTFFGNPIAGPFVLGISSGAKFTVALNMIFWVSMSKSGSSLSMILSAFAGALLSTAFIIFVSGSVRHKAGLLVAGIMIGYICSATTDFLLTFAEDKDIINLRGWSMGSFSGMSWDGVRVSAVVIGITLVITFLLSKPIGALRLGENYAKSMGVNVKVFRIVIILLSSVLSACVTAFAGPVSFVGIAVPFLSKQMLKSSDPVVLIPVSFMSGAVFCMLCDLIARCTFAPTELNISTVTSIFGAPIVIFMLMDRRLDGKV